MQQDEIRIGHQKEVRRRKRVQLQTKATEIQYDLMRS